MRVQKSQNGYDFYPIQPERTPYGIRLKVLPPPYSPRFRITTTHANPLAHSPEGQRLRRILQEWLETQKIELSN
jgi:hypothetical protein